MTLVNQVKELPRVSMVCLRYLILSFFSLFHLYNLNIYLSFSSDSNPFLNFRREQFQENVMPSYIVSWKFQTCMQLNNPSPGHLEARIQWGGCESVRHVWAESINILTGWNAEPRSTLRIKEERLVTNTLSSKDSRALSQKVPSLRRSLTISQC